MKSKIIRKRCKSCKKLFIPKRQYNRKQPFSIYCSQKCYWTDKVGTKGFSHPGVSGSDCHFWKGGKYKTPDGYIMILDKEHKLSNKRGYVGEHIKVMEETIGRNIRKSEVVHHIDFDKSNNKIENLQLMNKTEHKSMHMKIIRGR
jgi:hypothetical protein